MSCFLPSESRLKKLVVPSSEVGVYSAGGICTHVCVCVCNTYRFFVEAPACFEVAVVLTENNLGNVKALHVLVLQ